MPPDAGSTVECFSDVVIPSAVVYDKLRNADHTEHDLRGRNLCGCEAP